MNENLSIYLLPWSESTDDYSLEFDEDGFWYWTSKEDEEEDKKEQINADYPDTCPRCKAPAYQGLNSWDCSKCGRF